MALENWVDKQDGIDDILAEDINSIANAVIETQKEINEAVDTVYDDFGTTIDMSYTWQHGNDGIYTLPLTNIQVLTNGSAFLIFNIDVVIQVRGSLEDLQAIGFVLNKKYRIEIRNKEIVSLKLLDKIVDQDYNPKSANAQSGKAVKEALNKVTNVLQVLEEAVSDKQDSLVSGVNIKTINNQSILGSGNITIEGGSDVEVDQTYIPNSENPQSGKAVAEAVTTEQNRADNTFANALKGTASGSVILIDDVSPVAHEISVVLDVGGATVAKYGKNLAPSTFNLIDVPGLSITDNGDGSISIKGAVAENSFSQLITNFVLPRGTYCVSGIFPSDWELKYGYALIGGNSISASKTVITLSERKTVNLSFVFIAGVQYDLVIRPQIEVGTTSTEWEKYKEPIIYTADESGNVSGVTSLYPNTTLMTDTDGVLIDCEYNRDINKAFAALEAAIATNNS